MSWHLKALAACFKHKKLYFFFQHSTFMCFVWIWEQFAIISVYSANWLAVAMNTDCVLCEVWSEFFFCILLDLPLAEVVPRLRPLADSTAAVLFWICGERCGRGAGFPPGTSILLCQDHSVSATYSSSYTYTMILPEGRAGEARECNIWQKSAFAYFLILTRMKREHCLDSSEQWNFLTVIFMAVLKRNTCDQQLDKNLSLTSRRHVSTVKQPSSGQSRTHKR